MPPRSGPRQRRFPLGVSEEELVDHQVEDALSATGAERMAALVELLDTAYELWRTRGIAGDQGLCRFPGLAQQRRRGLCRDPIDDLIAMKEATGRDDKDIPDLERLRRLRDSG